MANIKEAIKILAFVEHNNDNTQVLHKNKGELGLTFWGIYQTAHPTLKIWNTINQYLKIEPDFKKLGQALVNNNEIMKDVEDFYKIHFWDKMKLDEVHSQHIANEIFIFGANVNWKVAAKETQKLIGLTGDDVDGFIGKNTLEILNKFNENKFDREFDEVEMRYYEKIALNKPHLAVNLKGWFNRARYVSAEIFKNDFVVV